ncbi:MAG: proteasome assembly chaperone family protein [Nanoarchaeota archaeon]
MELKEYPQRPIMIIGFPGFGLIGTISTEFLLEHLDFRKIGSIKLENDPCSIAIHKGHLIDPIGIYYNERYNIVLIHGMITPQGLEYRIAREIQSVAKALNPYEVYVLEGVASAKDSKTAKIYYHTTNPKKEEKLKEAKIKRLDEGIIIGVASGILQEITYDTICLFAQATSELPDSKASAKIIEALDKLLNLEVDPKPLLEQAKVFEKKLKGIMQQTSSTKKAVDQKMMNYVG